jgi:hypothetical protein
MVNKNKSKKKGVEYTEDIFLYNTPSDVQEIVQGLFNYEQPSKYQLDQGVLNAD